MICLVLCLVVGLPVLLNDSAIDLLLSGSKSRHPAAEALENFLNSIRSGDYDSAYKLIAVSAQTEGDATLRNLRVTKALFVAELRFDEERMAELRTAVALETEEQRKCGVAFVAPPSLAELQLHERNERNRPKFTNVTIRAVEQLEPDTATISLTMSIPNGLEDNDIAILLREDSQWRIANPIHLIR